jgi:pilus assembly protein CpaF
MANIVFKDPETGAQRSIQIRQSPFLIGRASDNDLVLNENSVSKLHCKIVAEANGLNVVDLKSRRGTTINGTPVEDSEVLAGGDQIGVGRVQLQLTNIRDASSYTGTPKPTKKATTESRGPIARAHSAGFGPLDVFLADPTISEIMVNGFDSVYVEKDGRIVKAKTSFSDEEELIEVAHRLLEPSGRKLDVQVSPMVDARFSDGSRINVILPPLSGIGTLLTIRKFRPRAFTAQELVDYGSMSKNIARFLKAAVENQQSILVSGGTGSGKTTLLNFISSFIGQNERIITIEDALELQLNQQHVLPLEARPPDLNGEGAIPIRQLLANSLRMRPDRIIVGECRGGEALDMLQAMNTGHDGSMTTLHANTARDALNRLETLVLLAGTELPLTAVKRQISSAIDIVVQQSRFPNGARRITEIVEISGIEGEAFSLNELFYFEERAGSSREGQHRPTGSVPKFMLDLKDRGEAVNLGMFQE